VISSSSAWRGRGRTVQAREKKKKRRGDVFLFLFLILCYRRVIGGREEGGSALLFRISFRDGDGDEKTPEHQRGRVWGGAGGGEGKGGAGLFIASQGKGEGIPKRLIFNRKKYCLLKEEGREGKHFLSCGNRKKNQRSEVEYEEGCRRRSPCPQEKKNRWFSRQEERGKVPNTVEKEGRELPLLPSEKKRRRRRLRRLPKKSAGFSHHTNGGEKGGDTSVPLSRRGKPDTHPFRGRNSSPH